MQMGVFVLVELVLKMIPNCRGCECEINEAFEWQERGYDVGLEGMGERRHCLFFVINRSGGFIVE